MNPLNVRMILGPKILKIESTNFGLFWTKNRLLSLCGSVESERIFSSVGRIVTKFRTRLSDDLPLKKREIFEKNETRFLEKITSRVLFLEFFTRRENNKH